MSLLVFFPLSLIMQRHDQNMKRIEYIESGFGLRSGVLVWSWYNLGLTYRLVCLFIYLFYHT